MLDVHVFHVGADPISVEIEFRECGSCGERRTAASELRAAELRAAVVLAASGVITGEGFRFMRKALGLPARDLATLLGIAHETISRWENGARPVDGLAWLALTMMVRDRVHDRRDTADALEAMADPQALPSEPLPRCDVSPELRAQCRELRAICDHAEQVPDARTREPIARFRNAVGRAFAAATKQALPGDDRNFARLASLREAVLTGPDRADDVRAMLRRGDSTEHTAWCAWVEILAAARARAIPVEPEAHASQAMKGEPKPGSRKRDDFAPDETIALVLEYAHAAAGKGRPKVGARKRDDVALEVLELLGWGVRAEGDARHAQKRAERRTPNKNRG